VSLLPAATEIVCELGCAARLVGVSHQCIRPSEIEALPRVTRSRIDAGASSGSIDSQAKTPWAAGEPLYEIDGELLTRLRPDLIIAQPQCDVCAVNFETVVRLAVERPELARCRVFGAAAEVAG
jgi:iron complex transport system substrate-binding protein